MRGSLPKQKQGKTCGRHVKKTRPGPPSAKNAVREPSAQQHSKHPRDFETGHHPTRIREFHPLGFREQSRTPIEDGIANRIHEEISEPYQPDVFVTKHLFPKKRFK